MSDSSSDGLLDNSRQFLWILFLSLFLIIFSISLSLLCHRACCFCCRYCNFQWKWPCCYFELQEYQRERRHLQQLRRLRQQHHLELATFSQIPGPIPDASFVRLRELRRQSAIRDLTSLGFIVVTPSSATSAADVNSLSMRNQLTPQQRREILDRILSCRTYHADDLDGVHHDKTEISDVEEATPTAKEDDNTIELQTVSSEEQPSRIQSSAFPLHEEPEEPEKTCAICLDSFAEGEIVANDTSKCPHVFHKSCLIEWLDNHDVCPCCRCTMITDTEWRHAAANNVSQLSNVDARIQETPSPASTTGAAGGEGHSNDVESNERMQQEAFSTVSSATNNESPEPEMVDST